MNPRFSLLFVVLLIFVGHYQVVEAKECECDDEETPVCGSDGVTYKNECQFICCTDAPVYIEHEGTCANQSSICPDIFLPICGTDGKTYGNDCFAKLAGVCEASPGACPVKCDCKGLKKKPVCGSDGVTYKNKCQFHCCTDETVYLKHEGKCSNETIACPDYDLPTCGTDGNTYPNPCFAKRAGVCQASQGACPSPSAECDCKDLKKNPVCGSDGITYQNRCQFHCCTAKPVSIEHEGKCTDEFDVCPLFVLPVCGTDGKTYNNFCFAKLAGVCVRSQGACKTPQPANY